MGGFFGAISKRDVTLDIFFGVDYHSHLGTRRGGMIIYDGQDGPTAILVGSDPVGFILMLLLIAAAIGAAVWFFRRKRKQ